jgi:hypothetical protein
VAVDEDNADDASRPQHYQLKIELDNDLVMQVKDLEAGSRFT